MTMHHVTGMEDNIIPSKRSLEENADNILEVFYVALTCAKKELIINNEKKRESQNGEIRTALPSHFLSEIPSELIMNEKKKLNETIEKNNINYLRILLKIY